MRDHPTVPNVFRVASSHSINSMGVMATPLSNSLQQQQQQQLQHQAQQQQQQQQQLCSNNIQYRKSNSYEQQQQQQLINSNLQYCNTNNYDQQQQPQIELQQLQVQQKHLARHQLTTSASIEHTQQQQRQQHSPYATLPRGGQRLVLHQVEPPPQQQQQQQELEQQQQQLQAGVINTISGGIPATGCPALGGSISDLQLNNLQLNNLQLNNLGNNNNDMQQQQEQELQQQQLQHQQQLQLQQQQQQPQQNQQPSTATTSPSPTVAGSNAPDAPNSFSNMSSGSTGYLWLLTPVAASISVAIVIAAIAGPQWLFTEEKLPNANYNGTANFNALDDGVYVTKYTKSSLWILCTTGPDFDAEPYNCIKIDYFPNENYQPDPHDSTLAIPYTVTKSCPIFLLAGFILMISFIIFLIPTCSSSNHLYYFSAGILFIVSGLIMLIGLIAYISILKAEIGSKLRPRSTLQPALFKVTYGQSFFLFVFGFIATEFVGVLNIFLYIHLQEFNYYNQRISCFSLAAIHARFWDTNTDQEREDSYRRYAQPAAAAAAAAVASSEESLPQPTPQQLQQQMQQHQQRLRGQAAPMQLPPQQQQQQQQQQQPQAQPLQLALSNGRLHRVHDVARGLPGQTQTLPAGDFACRKHPNGGSNLNLYLHNDLERRFYFEKPAVSKCNLHSRSFAKSLNELCVEPTPPVAPPSPPLPPPLTFADLPQEFPLTRSVSTTTDIYNPSSAAPLKRKQKRNMATNTQQLPLPLASVQDDEDEETQARLCGLKRGLRKTKDELFQEFCKRAGVRNKPKNIYVISSGDEPEEPPRRHSNNNRNNASNSTSSGSNIRKNNNSSRDENPHAHVEEAEEDTENGFGHIRPTPAAMLDEDHLYVVGDHVELVMPRRASMCLDAMGAQSQLLSAPQQFPQLRKLNSNLSLHTPQSEIWPWPSQQRLASEHGQSRTLPRCFLRQPAAAAGSQDSLGSLQSSYSYSNASANANQQRFTQMMQQQQQQLQQRYLSTLTLPIPLTMTLPQPQPQQQQQQLQQQQLQGRDETQMQWPTAIPSSPSNYGHVFPPQPLFAPVTSNAAAIAAAAAAAAHPPKFQRAYAFDEAQRRGSFTVSDAFDLDEMERERRRSHASLFGGLVMPQAQLQSQLQSQYQSQLQAQSLAQSQYQPHLPQQASAQSQSLTREQYDLINGTAV